MVSTFRFSIKDVYEAKTSSTLSAYALASNGAGKVLGRNF